jgi:hypothetical protein
VAKTSKKAAGPKNGGVRKPGKPKKAEPAKEAKPVRAEAKGGGAVAQAQGEEQTVAQARRLTPEAKAAINSMVQKGVPLAEALRRAASWETFVAPVREEQKPGGDFRLGGGGGGAPRRFKKRSEEDDEESEESESEAEE